MKASVQQKDKKKMQPILLYRENNNAKILDKCNSITKNTLF